MKLVSWNVNGLRATLAKGLGEWMDELAPDILCFQEIKARPEQVSDLWLSSWQHQLWNPAQRPGYSGVLILSKIKPLSTRLGINAPEHDTEGRVCTMEFDQFYLVNCYTPNSQNELARLPYRREWNEAFRQYVVTLADSKPVIFCGDLNVAHEEIDIARPKDNHFSAGFSDEEREDFTHLLDAGFIDTFRHTHPNVPEQYSWWSYRGGARARNVGWRIDYVCMSPALLPDLISAEIYPDIVGSDHCPVGINITMS
ncbi:MAG: exodeoxyribonuclease III [Akkermansia sp.]